MEMRKEVLGITTQGKDNSKQSNKKIDYSADPEEDNEYLDKYEEADEPDHLDDLMMDDDEPIFPGKSKNAIEKRPRQQ